MTPARLRLGGRELELRLTPRASRALAARGEPLDIELELYFSCFIRKRVNFHARAPAGAVAQAALSDRVSVSFHPVMTRACRVAEVHGAPGLETFPILHPGPFTPRWLALDFKRGAWRGEFGFY